MIEAVECSKCGRLHKKGAETYFKLEGSLYIGEDGGVLGGKPDNAEQQPVSYWCRAGCLKEILAQYHTR